MQHRARDAITFFILLANDRSRRRLLRPDIQRQHSEEKIKNDAGQHLCVWIRRADTMWHMRQSHFAASGLKLDAIGNDNDTVDARRHCLCRCAARNRIVRGSLGCLYAECAQTLSRLQCLIHRNRIILHEAISQTNEATLFQMRRQHRQSYNAHNFTPVIRSFSHSAVTRQGNWNNIFMFLFVLLLLFAFAAKSALVKQMKNIMKSFISRWVMLLIVWFAVKKRPNMTAFEMLCVECTPVDTINRRHNQGFSHWMALCVHVFSPHRSTWQPMTNFVKTYLRIRVKYIYLILLLCFRYILQMDICTLCHSYIRCASDDAHKSIPYYSLTHHCSVLCAAANLITIASNSLPASFMPNHNALYI